MILFVENVLNISTMKNMDRMIVFFNLIIHKNLLEENAYGV